MLNLCLGEAALVESPTNAFEPFEVHYAETFIIPAGIGEYTLTPSGNNKDNEPRFPLRRSAYPPKPAWCSALTPLHF